MEKKISYIAIVYFLIGLVFGFFYAWYYSWPVVGYFSPGFWMVIITWPFQTIGFIRDLTYYGLAGKPI